MSSTPRTEAIIFWSDIGGWVAPASKFKELELELNAISKKSDEQTQFLLRMENFINRFFDPEDLGYVVTPSVRDDAREALGRERVES